MALTTPWAGRLADKIDRRYVVLGGLTMFALASYWFSFITLEHSMNWVIWMIVGRYITPHSPYKKSQSLISRGA
jgi:MFS family permease